MTPVSADFKNSLHVAPRKMLILSSTGGGGHKAAEAAITSLFESTFQIEKMYPIQEIRICRRPFVEECYNFMLQKGYVRTASLVSRFAAPFFSAFTDRCSGLTQKLESRFDDYEPDIIVSVAPLVNAAAIRAAHKRNIPYLLVTTDHHVGNWFPGGRKIGEGDSPLLKVTVGADLPCSKGLLIDQGIKEENIEVTGLPIRQDFLDPKPDRRKLCEELGLPYLKKIILIMSGGVGSPRSVTYAQKTFGKPSSPQYPRGCHLRNRYRLFEDPR